MQAHARLVWRFAALLIAPLVFVVVTYSSAAAQIVIDGNIAEPDWHQLGTSAGGPPPGFGAGNEINALYADINTTYLYLAVAGNIQFGNRMLIFIDSRPGGYGTGNFGRVGAPPGLVNFNSGTVFDIDFLSDYVLVIGASADQLNNTWDLYTLSGTVGVGGGPNLYLGDRNDVDLGATPSNSSTTNGFEARLTYSSSGAGVDLMINQSYVQLFAMYISDAGFVSNQFISRADFGAPNFGNGPINFVSATPNPVYFTHFFVVNEVDYMRPGYDEAEFIELLNITSLTLNLDPYQLRLVNGFGGGASIYRVIDLPTYTMTPGQYFVVCGLPPYVANCNLDASPDVGLLENVLPSAVALVHQPSNVIIDTVSYGGNTGGPYTEGGGVNVYGEGDVPGLGISRIPDGVDTNRNFVDFTQRCITPGQPNFTHSTHCAPGPGRPPPTHTPTPTPSPTVTPLPTLPASCMNMLVNGDFESDGGWDWMFGNSPLPGKYTSTEKHGGLRAAQLGDPADPNTYAHGKASYSSIRQLVHVPKGYSIAQLRWWHYYKTEEPTTAHPYTNSDRQEVILLTSSGHTLKVLHRVLRNDGAWQQESVDITEFRGRSVYVYFNVFNDANKQRTWMYLDDVMLEVCPPGAGNGNGSATPTGTVSPTATPTVTPSMTPSPTTSPTPSPTNTPTATPIVQLIPQPTSTLIAQAPPPPTWTPFSSSFIASASPTAFPTAASTSGPSGVIVLSRPTTLPTAPSSSSAPFAAATIAPTIAQTGAATLAPALAVAPDAASRSFGASVAPDTPTPSIISRANPPAVLGRGCVDLIVNGDFEAIGPGWTLPGSPTMARYVANPSPSTASASGNQAIEIGIVDGANSAAISAVEQTITLPVAQSVILNFHFYPLYDVSPGPGDLQYVDIFHAETDAFAGRALSAQQNDRVWLARSYDITRLAGQPIRLVFAVNNDGVQGRTAMIVDNVALIACNFGSDILPAAILHPTPPIRPAAADDRDESFIPVAARISSLSLVTTPTILARTEQVSPQATEERAQPWAVAIGAITLWAGIIGVLGISFLAVLNAFRSS